MTHFDLIIFDCDGTLTDSEYLNNLATVRLIESFGLEGYTIDDITTRFLGSYLSKIAVDIERETGFKFPPNHNDLYTDLVVGMLPEYLKPVPDALETVKFLKDNHSVCVASNGQRKNVVESLRATDILPLFGEDKVFTIENVSKGKPSPDLFLFAAKAMNAASERCLVIEDSVAGTTAGKAAGMTVFGFTGVAHDKAQRAIDLQKAGADVIFDSFIHIREALTIQKPCLSAARRVI